MREIFRAIKSGRNDKLGGFTAKGALNTRGRVEIGISPKTLIKFAMMLPSFWSAGPCLVGPPSTTARSSRDGDGRCGESEKEVWFYR